jgi:hypothetical protein
MLWKARIAPAACTLMLFCAVTPVSAQLSVPILSSRAAATTKLYLDFDGDVSDGWGSYFPGVTPAYSIDSNYNAFSSAEISNINAIFQAVAEKFSPFDLDVTTSDPGPFNERAFRIVIGGLGNWYGGGGGTAYLNSYTDPFLPNTAWVFSERLLPFDPLHTSFVGEAIAHESGHGFGLNHQSRWENGQLVQQYHDGNATAAPIMGRSYRKRGVWFHGSTEIGPNAIQDDLAILSGAVNGFGYRPDDHGDSAATATTVSFSGATFTASGVIERTDDLDFFSFTIAADANLTFNLLPAAHGAMLDGSLGLYDATGTLMQLIDTPSLGETMFATLSAGQYALAVLSHGSYGDIGQYTLTGTLSSIPEPTGMVLTLLGAALLRRRSKSA